MIRNITFSAEEELIKKARVKALAEKSTLNVLFRRWLKQYVERKQIDIEIDLVMESLNHVYSGKKFSREELNER